jgi:hypothetical protein
MRRHWRLRVVIWSWSGHGWMFCYGYHWNGRLDRGSSSHGKRRRKRRRNICCWRRRLILLMVLMLRRHSN